MNDKTIIRYYTAVAKIRRDPVYTEKVYTLFDENGQPFERQGNYSIVDNGYNKWGILIPPTKYPQTDTESKWSKALGSVRKGVKCIFSILKGRFRILKLGILFQDKNVINNLFFTCCTSHNMLHAFDGLYELELVEEWGGRAGFHDAWDNGPLLDESTMGYTSPTPADDDGTTTTTEAVHEELKNARMTHFEFRRSKNGIRWLRHATTG
ncbi:unnamed protein product [Ectocarpus sp. 4 AP-2014]